MKGFAWVLPALWHLLQGTAPSRSFHAGSGRPRLLGVNPPASRPNGGADRPSVPEPRAAGDRRSLRRCPSSRLRAPLRGWTLSVRLARRPGPRTRTGPGAGYNLNTGPGMRGPCPRARRRRWRPLPLQPRQGPAADRASDAASPNRSVALRLRGQWQLVPCTSTSSLRARGRGAPAECVWGLLRVSQ